MHLHTKILGPSCRLMCEPVGPSLCTHQGGHKILSKPEPFPNEILSRGRKWGREGLPHLHGSWEFGFLIPHPTDSPSERNRAPQNLCRQEAFGIPWRGTLYSLRNPFLSVPVSRLHCSPIHDWGNSIHSPSSRKPAPPKSAWSSGFTLFKDPVSS